LHEITAGSKREDAWLLARGTAHLDMDGKQYQSGAVSTVLNTSENMPKIHYPVRNGSIKLGCAANLHGKVRAKLH
jgi:hypothetical protein